MERHLLQLQHLSPQDHLLVSSGFFNACGSAVHFSSGGGGGGGGGLIAAPVALDQCEWLQNLVQLGGEEMFDGGVDCISIGTAADRQPWRCDGGSSDVPRPAAPLWEESVVGEVASEVNGDDDGNVAGTRKRRDRAKTIVSERKRRVRMQEQLYELRSLVPNITKMDKASIIADAVEYVKNLQSHARKLQEEVAALEARPRSSPEQENDRRAAAKRHDNAAESTCSGDTRHGGARVAAHVGATRVGEGRFLVTIECERRDGAAAPLCAAVESLACFRVESSSLGRSAPDRVVSTFTLKATCEAESATIGEGTVKLLVMAALGEQGFRPEATASGIS